MFDLCIDEINFDSENDTVTLNLYQSSKEAGSPDPLVGIELSYVNALKACKYLKANFSSSINKVLIYPPYKNENLYELTELFNSDTSMEEAFVLTPIIEYINPE